MLKALTVMQCEMDSLLDLSDRWLSDIFYIPDEMDVRKCLENCTQSVYMVIGKIFQQRSRLTIFVKSLYI